MDRYKLMNTVKRKLIKSAHYQSIKKVKYTRKLVRDLFDKYDCMEFLWHHYCCKGEDWNCWIDEDVGWERASLHGVENPQAVINKFFLRNTLQTMNELPKHGYNMNVYVAEAKNHITLAIPLRDVKTCDLYIVFSKK